MPPAGDVLTWVASFADDVVHRMVRKMDVRLLPTAAVTYLLCYIDRSNIGEETLTSSYPTLTLTLIPTLLGIHNAISAAVSLTMALIHPHQATPKSSTPTRETTCSRQST